MLEIKNAVVVVVLKHNGLWGDLQIQIIFARRGINTVHEVHDCNCARNK